MRVSLAEEGSRIVRRYRCRSTPVQTESRRCFRSHEFRVSRGILGARAEDVCACCIAASPLSIPSFLHPSILPLSLSLPFSIYPSVFLSLSSPLPPPLAYPFADTTVQDASSATPTDRLSTLSPVLQLRHCTAARYTHPLTTPCAGYGKCTGGGARAE